MRFERLGPVVLTAILGLAACGSETQVAPNPAGGELAEHARRATDGLCTIAGGFTEDLEGASGAFYDRAHDSLHEIAATVEDVDRAVAARLLVAKERVEEDLRAPTLPETFAEDVAELLGTTRDALAALDLPAPDC